MLLYYGALLCTDMSACIASNSLFFVKFGVTGQHNRRGPRSPKMWHRLATEVCQVYALGTIFFSMGNKGERVHNPTLANKLGENEGGSGGNWGNAGEESVGPHRGFWNIVSISWDSVVVSHLLWTKQTMCQCCVL